VRLAESGRNDHDCVGPFLVPGNLLCAVLMRNKLLQFLYSIVIHGVRSELLQSTDYLVGLNMHQAWSAFLLQHVEGIHSVYMRSLWCRLSIPRSAITVRWLVFKILDIVWR
jgi:hypothetical protein